VQRPLPLFAADDPAGHALFLEGVTLLAYDVAWLCRSQGVPVGEAGSFEDVCNIGQNLFNLLIATQGRSPSRTSSTKGTPTKTTGREGEVNGEREKERAGGLMGYYSHGTAHSYLGSSAGVEFTRGFKLPSPTKLVDKLKSRLASEVANAEWEILDPDAWAIEDDLGQQQQQEQQAMLLGEEGDGIVVGARREGDDVARGVFGWEGGGGGNAVRRYGYGMQSFMSMRTVMDAVEVIGGVAAGGERKSGNGTSGWTKLKPR
jgi:autophagy-related ATG14-like protein